MESSFTGGTAVTPLNANHEYFRPSTTSVVCYFRPYLGPRAAYSSGTGGSRLLKPTLNTKL